MKQQFSRGQSVLVSDYQGRLLERKVWSDNGGVVFITSGRNYEALENGQSRIWPIGVPRETVSVTTAVTAP